MERKRIAGERGQDASEEDPRKRTNETYYWQFGGNKTRAGETSSCKQENPRRKPANVKKWVKAVANGKRQKYVDQDAYAKLDGKNK